MTGPRVPVITVTEVRRLMTAEAALMWLVHATDAVLFIDRHIPGAIQLPTDRVVRQLGLTALLIVYGEDPLAHTAPSVAEDLHRHGIEVSWLAGGLQAWVDAGLAVEGRQAATGP